MATCINYVLHVYVSNLTTGMDRPHQNTHSIKKLANYMVGNVQGNVNNTLHFVSNNK